MNTALSVTDSQIPTYPRPLSAEEVRQIDAYWRAANYLSVGQIYLLDNPLLRDPLTASHIKPRLLGHWGTTPGLNIIYAHLNRIIRQRDTNVMLVTGPGHGGPGVVANTYLEGSYSRFYAHIGQDLDGLRKLFRQFSFPGGIPSHTAPETPGSIHEGGELGYALAHAYGAALIIQTWWSRALSATGRPRPGPSPRAGTPTNSSILPPTARCYPSCISTATRLPTRRYWLASPKTISRRF